MKEAPYLSCALIVMAAVAGALGLTSCAASADPCNAVLPDAPSSLVWPASPEKARLAYVGVLQDNTACKLAPTETPLSLSYPRAITAGPDGRIFVSDRAGVRAIDTKTGHMSPFANAAGHEAQNARGLVAAPDGRVFIADAKRAAVVVYSSSNQFLAEIGAGLLERPQGVALDEERGRIFVADSAKNAVFGFGLDGAHLATIESTDQQQLAIPTQVAVNSLGEVHVVHQGAPKVLVYDAAGKSLHAFGDEGTGTGQFVRPKGIAIDSEDHVYVTDAAFDNIQVFDREGHLLLPVGQAGEGKGEFNLPFMLAIDTHDRIYVAEYGNHRVQVLQYLGGKQAR